MADLMGGVDTAVRTPGHHHRDPAKSVLCDGNAKHGIYGGFELALNGAQPWLSGPSVKIRPVIGEIKS